MFWNRDKSQYEKFPIIPAKPTGFYLIIGCVLVGFLLAPCSYRVSSSETKMEWIDFLVITLVFLLLLTPFFWISYWRSQKMTFWVSREDLRISGIIIGRVFPKSSLDLEKAMILDLSKSHNYDLIPSFWRRKWQGWPGFQSGWHDLDKGGKVLAFVTDETRVLYIPTHDGFSLMLSTSNPQKMLDALRC